MNLNSFEINAGRALSACAKQFYERGWMWGTSGNLSLRLKKAPSIFLVTPSGVNKGALEPEQLIVIGDDQPRCAGASRPKPGQEPLPSAETQVHQMLYETEPECHAVLHVHPAAATFISGVFGHALERRLLPLAWIEMMKGVGVMDGRTGILPIFPNWQDIPRFAGEVKDYWMNTPGQKIPAILIYNHGLTAWGRTLDEARNHLEVLEYVCDQRYRELCAQKEPST